jgi:N6-L-threonylcarbamoyladenine synthase
MKILAIETSCDETALSIISTSNENFSVLSDLVISQIDIHAQYGGVFPKLAKREHAKNLVPLLEQSLKDSGLHATKESEMYENEALKNILEREPELYTELCNLLSEIETPGIDAIMVTHGPGLAPALWVGVNFARALSVAWNVPLMPVNHMEGHVSSILLKEDYLNQDKALYPLESYVFPMIALLISGGHTQLVLVRNWGEYQIIGETIDDAVGEAFDKVARMLGMEYPGGPKISQAARNGKENEVISLPRPMINTKDYQFSLSGLKTAARYLIDDLNKQNRLDDQTVSDISREFEHAVTEVLLEKTKKALIEYDAQGLIIAGGVSANTFITESFKQLIENQFSHIKLFLPEKKLCGDNSLMIASAGFLKLIQEKENAFTPQGEVKAVSNLKL